MGTCLTTLHIAFNPHEPKQGSIHFMLMQALLLLQSVFSTHSGLQFGGLPKYPILHEQEGTPPTSLHSAFCPQGEGMQGFICSIIGGVDSGCTKQREKGSPACPALHEQIGLCFITLQSVFMPHPLGHGDIHLKFSQALSKGHSELVVHSGLHKGGEPE